MNIEEIKTEAQMDIKNMLTENIENTIKWSTEYIEAQGVNFLKSELNKYGGIFDAEGITTKDKGISYDGKIEVKKLGGNRVDDWRADIDVQVKSTTVERFKKGNSKFPIEIAHLRNYVRHPLGVLLFVIYIDKKTQEKKLYYRYLLPLDLEKIFRNIDKNDNQPKSIDIYPIELEQKSALKRVCLQYITDRNMQSNKRIVTLSADNMPKEIMGHNIIPESKGITKDNTYFYGKFNDEDGFVPVILPEDAELELIIKKNKKVIIDGKEFYDSYEEITNNAKKLYKLGNGIIIDEDNMKITYKFCGTLNEIIRDSEFLIETSKKYGTDKENEKMLINLNSMIKEFVTNLKTLKINFEEKIREITNKDLENIDYFNRLLKNDETIISNIKESQILKVLIQDMVIVIFVEKNENDVKVYNFYDNIHEKFVFFSEDDNENRKLISPYTTYRENNIENVINFDFESIKKTLEKYENNEINFLNFNYLGIMLINAYDRTKENCFYEYAKYIFEKLITIMPDNEYVIVNCYQLKKRRQKLEKEEIEKLYKIKNESLDNSILYAVAVLLENKSDVKYYYDKLEESYKKEIEEFPIRYLEKTLLK